MSPVNETSTSEAVQSLGLEELDHAWIQAVWDADFIDLPPAPPLLDDLTTDGFALTCSLQKVIKALALWDDPDLNESEASRGFWNVLSDINVLPKGLVTFLFHCIKRVDRALSSAVEKEGALLAAQVYLLLIRIPGSGAYGILHPFVFEEALDTLKLWPSTDPGKRKRTSSNSQSQPSQSKAQRSSRGRNQVTAFSDSEDDSDDESICILTPQEVKKLQLHVVNTLKELVHLLRRNSIKSWEQTMDSIISRLTEVTRNAQEGHLDLQLDEQNVSGCTSLVQLAYHGLKALASQVVDGKTEMLRHIFKHLLPNLLMLMGDNEAVAAANIPSSVLQVKNAAVQFVCHMVAVLGEPSLTTARILLQHMCIKVPDKSEYRAKVSQLVATILNVMSLEAQGLFVQWIYKVSKGVKISNRVFALEVVMAIMENNAPDVNCTQPNPSEPQCVPHTFLLALLISRMCDKAPTVRAKALACMGQFTATNNPHITLALKNLLTNPSQPFAITPMLLTGNQETSEETSSPNPAQNEMELGENMETEEQREAQKKGATPGNLDGGSPFLLTDVLGGQVPDLKSFLATLKKRACDEKVVVRKAALQVLENVVTLDSSNLDQEAIKVLQIRCRDVALSVRKQAIAAITHLLHTHKTNKMVQRAWLDAIFPIVLDREVTAQERALGALYDAILANIVTLSRSHGPDHQLAWELLDILASPDGYELRLYLKKACSLWHRFKQLNTQMVKALCTHLQGDHVESAWMLLARITYFMPTLDPEITTKAWMAQLQTDRKMSLMMDILSTMSYVTNKMEGALLQEIEDNLTNRLLRFEDAPQLTSAMLDALCKIRSGSDPTNVNEAMKPITTRILQACVDYLSKIILTEDKTLVSWSDDDLVRYIFTLGEVALLSPNHTQKIVFTLVHSLLVGGHQTPSVLSSQTQYQSHSQSQTSQPPQSQSQSQTSQPSISQFGGDMFSCKVRTYTFMTLGKLCLQHESVAKQSVAALARELETSPDFSVRNNVMIVMCGLCKRYTNLVDRYIPNIAACLKDESELVRKQTLTMLTDLLLEDYVKWRGPLFFRFITTLIDESKDIQQLTEYCLVHLLLKRQPGMLFQHFVEAIFHFNSYENHNIYNKFTQTDRERRLFSLKGPENAERRMKLYRFMLKHMTDEHRFNLTAKLSQDVLGTIVDQILPMNTDTEGILKDTLAVLSCKEIKLSSLRSKPANAVEIADEIEMAEAVMAQAKNKLISQVVKKNVIENIIPVVTSLKHMLEKLRSPMLKDLMLYLKELMKDYRNEIKDILAADKQLAEEIEFDLRRFEEQERKAAEQQQRDEAAKREGDRRASVGTRPPIPQAQTPAPPRSIPNTPQRTSLGLPKGTPPIPLTPRMFRSPKLRTAPSTPANKEIELVTKAIINSARKALASAHKRGRQTPSGTPLRELQENVMAEEAQPDTNGLAQSNQEGNESEEDVKPDVNELEAWLNKNRAISTPDRTIIDVTFHAPMDMSIIPLTSPRVIPTSLPLRMYSDEDPTKAPGTKSWTPQLESEETGESRQRNLILMCSPEHPPKPRKWNVKPKNVTKELNVSLKRLKNLSPDLGIIENETPSGEKMEATRASGRRQRTVRMK